MDAYAQGWGEDARPARNRAPVGAGRPGGPVTTPPLPMVEISTPEDAVALTLDHPLAKPLSSRYARRRLLAQ